MSLAAVLGYAALVAVTEQAKATPVAGGPRVAGSAAQIDGAPNQSKLALIRRYLEVTGLQGQLDNGSFLDRHALNEELWRDRVPSSGELSTFSGLVKVRFAALRKAYASRRAAYQSEYESHLNWEFREDELSEIVTFLESPAGQHYLEGDWRMRAYVGTNTEELEAEIVREAAGSLAKP